ncbi:MAG TPA: hypothetical protein VIJ68_01650 [Candidatus Saccharimonadales bacterium]
MSTNTNQRGFSTVEGLLILIIVLLIGFIGYYVWHAQKSASDTLNSASKASQSSPTKVAPAKWFKLADLGVEFKLPSTLSDLQSAPNDNGGYFLSVANMESIYKQCNGSNLPPGPISSEDYSFAGLSRHDGTFEQDSVAEESLLKQFGTFNITISYPNGPECASEDQTVLDQWTTAKKNATETFVKAFQTSATEIK